MKKYFILFVSLFIVLYSFSQNKKITEMHNLYKTHYYAECIIKAEKYVIKENKFSMPYFLCGFSYYKLSGLKKGDAKYLDIKDALKNIYKGTKKDDKDEYLNNFSKENTAVHDTTISMLNFYYNVDNIKAKFLANYLIKLYNDTTEAYNELILNIKPRPDKEIIELTNKGLLNQTDETGLKQGKWEKVYANGNTAYEVTFVNDKPVGEFKRFYESGNLYAILLYNQTGDSAYAKFYSETNMLLSEGAYVGKNKEGLWKYYDNKLLVRSEEFLGDSLNGKQIIYYSNGQIYDEKMWVNGIENGLWQKFYETGEQKLKSVVKNGKLEGPMLRYYKSGSIEVKGLYKNDLAEGEWIYYSENGEKQIINYKNGIPDNIEQIEKENSENYKKTLDMSKRLIDPADYKNNPQEYRNKADANNSGSN